MVDRGSREVKRVKTKKCIYVKLLKITLKISIAQKVPTSWNEDLGLYSLKSHMPVSQGDKCRDV